jgi:CBS-domain-containing membrane protein
MKRSLAKMAEELRLYWKNYVFQSLLAVAAMVVVMLALRGQRMVLVASVGSSAFIVFAMPSALTAQPRNVVGGQLVGVLCGSLCAVLGQTYGVPMAWYALAVGLSVFVMVVIDTEHPPAAGTALGMAKEGLARSLLPVAGAVIVAAVILSALHHFLRGVMRDLD